jgi:alpha-galactosidase
VHEATICYFEIPFKYGLKQTIGDTIGVGGIFRGLRTFPVLADIARDMEQVCPDAWLLNYTNPMAMNITYLHHVAPRLKVLGLCHSVYWTMVGLCELVDVPFEDVSYWSAGVNHQAWVLRWERGGQELYPLLDQRIASDPELRRRVGRHVPPPRLLPDRDERAFERVRALVPASFRRGRSPADQRR